MSDIKFNEIDELFKELISDEMEEKIQKEIDSKINETVSKYRDEILQLNNLIIKKTREMAKIKKSNKLTQLANSCESKPIYSIDVGKVLTDLIQGNNVYLYGFAGTGKTFLAEAIAKYEVGQKPYTIICNQWTSPSTIIGGNTIDGWKEGTLIKAWRDGGVLILDELPKLEPNTAGLLNDALAKTGAGYKKCVAWYNGKLDIGNEIMFGKEKEGAIKGKTEIITVTDDNPSIYIYVEKGKLKKITDTNGKMLDIRTDFLKSGQGIYFVPTITDGMGELIPKHTDFKCIATGNTNLKSTDVRYGGNYKQDYSLVDRFNGSFYKINENKEAEIHNNYTFVFFISNKLRDILRGMDSEDDISLRTMLNFSRIYEAEKLYKMDSPFKIEGISTVKTLKESIESFIDGMEEDNKKLILDNPEYNGVMQTIDSESLNYLFIYDFWRKYGVSPITGKASSFMDTIKEFISDIVRSNDKEEIDKEYVRVKDEIKSNLEKFLPFESYELLQFAPEIFK